MNDLSGLSWDAVPQKPKPSPSANYNIPSIRAQTPPSDPLQRQPTPLSSTQSGNGPKPVSKAAVNDSFSNLISSTSSKSTASLSLQERQKQLQEEHSRRATQQSRNTDTQYNADDARFWEELESRSSTPALPTSSVSSLPARADSANVASADEGDILAAFNTSAPVDASSNFPPPKASNDFLQPSILGDSSKRWRTPSPAPSSGAASDPGDLMDNGEDDPFGLGKMERPQQRIDSRDTQQVDDQEDDILGDLGKPVSEVDARKRQQKSAPATGDNAEFPAFATVDPRDRAIAELVDMGFSTEQARQALDQTSSGANVQEAVGIILNQAHHQSKEKSRQTSQGRERSQETAPRAARSAPSDEAVPTWMRRQKDGRGDSRSPAPTGSEGVVEKDVTHVATEFSQTFFKSANMLWKTGQKRIQKVIAEYQHEGESSTPRWMRDAHPEHEENAAGAPVSQQKKGNDVTDEAVLLESGRSKSQPDVSTKRAPGPKSSNGTAIPPSAQQRPLERPPPPQNQPLPTKPQRPQDRVSKQATEEQSSQAYVSPARRRKPQPVRPAEPEESLDIFSSTEKSSAVATAAVPSETKVAAPRSVTTPARSSAPPQVRSKAAPRQIPSVSPSALSASNEERRKGSEAFKRGDYAEAHTHYNNALAALPPKHPITIILQCNRALTSIKMGDPKSAISDCDAALTTIGASRGDGETISTQEPTESDKPMKEFFGKALMRKAEALENMEKWTDAAKVWREAVEAGVGGAVSIQGRNRCEKAAGIGPAAPSRPASAPPKPRKAPPPPSALADLNGAAEGEAVKRLRAAEAAAAAASDEAFSLSDGVDARLTGWKSGKEGNLRALLASLDTVLWEGAGWNKVSMGDLVLPGRVKIVYMKAIAKCHPDKIPQSATTEQKMISASVFATLNEAWDRFKKDNGL